MYCLILIIAIETVIIVMGALAWDHGVDAAIEAAAVIAERSSLLAAYEIRQLKNGARP